MSEIEMLEKELRESDSAFSALLKNNKALRQEAVELIKSLYIAKTALNKIYDNPYYGTSVSNIAEEAIQSIKSIRERKEVK